jgi:hypothetical protein
MLISRRDVMKRSVCLQSIIFVLFIVSLIAGCGGGNGSSVLNINPASKSVVAGQDFTLDADIDPGTDNVNAVELHIKYDKTKFSLNSLNCSSAFPNILLAPLIPSPQDGTARIDCGIPTSDSPVINPSTVATLSFHAIAPVTKSSIAIMAQSQVAAVGEPESVVKTIKSASITVTP